VSPRGARLALVGLLALSAACFAASGRIYVKAWLAQRLLLRAWAETRGGTARAKPWPWADTWPVARLSVPRHRVELIVLADASGRSLAFGPGHVGGTAPLGADGNTVLSGHRDTQFRFLKDLALGDEIRLETADGATHAYAVTGTFVVHTSDPGVTEEIGAPRLTLVTCYPFDAVVPGGPLRYVVEAEPAVPTVIEQAGGRHTLGPDGTLPEALHQRAIAEAHRAGLGHVNLRLRLERAGSTTATWP
jgi:sortase A